MKPMNYIKIQYALKSCSKTILLGSISEKPMHLQTVYRLIILMEITLWSLGPTHADFLVSEKHKVQVYRRLKSRGMNHSVLMMDVQRRIDLVARPPAERNEELLRIVSHVATSQNPYWSKKVSYKGAQVWRVTFNYVKQVVLLKSLEQNKVITLWSLGPTHADFLVSEEHKVQVHRRLKSRGINHSVLMMDVQRRIDLVARPPAEWNEESLRIGHRLDFTFYPEMHVIDEYFSFIKEQYKSICTIKTIGRSTEERDIKMAVVSNGNPANKAILLIGGLHGREWISIASVLYILNNLLTQFDSQPVHVKNMDWYIVPVVNPDGYVFSHTTDRFWRKNRHYWHWSKCVGVDLNRNFGMNWAVKGLTDTNFCSEAYSGQSAFSEPESIAIKNVAAMRKMAAFVDIHSYGQSIMYPYSSSEIPVKDQTLLETLAEKMTTAIYGIQQKSYISGPVSKIQYVCSGSALDYMYDSGVSLSYAIETRDEGYSGFLLSPEEIVDTSVELQAGLLLFVVMATEPYTERGRTCLARFLQLPLETKTAISFMN